MKNKQVSLSEILLKIEKQTSKNTRNAFPLAVLTFLFSFYFDAFIILNVMRFSKTIELWTSQIFATSPFQRKIYRSLVSEMSLRCWDIPNSL